MAGTNAGVSEVSLSDTSSSNSNPPNGATAENRAESPAEAVHASTPASLAEQSPRQGWWKRRTAETADGGISLVQVGGEGVRESAKTTPPDLVTGGDQTTNTLSGSGEEACGSDFNSQDAADSVEAPTSTASPRNGFEGLGLAPEVLKAVAQSGYTTPTPIQAQGIPPVLARRDIIGIAQTGTGKTASFTLPMIELLARGRPKARMPRSLILEPTRELAAQVAESFEKYGKYNKLSMALLI
ncbi:MAG: DEAD/DEAH box helicase, partial [Rhizomicrobium sp.]